MTSARKLLMNGHEVVRFAPRFRKALGEKVIKGGQIFNLPILASSHFTEITPELDESRILFLLHGAFPGQNLIHLVEDEQATTPVQLRFHDNAPVSRQMRPANQDWLLLVSE